ncbi:50s ribosomal protein l21 [Cystoisospora suis]|uniref:50s ribosomal protein l21 n=1 Tax=Cystoisospora suis TaxID=483139 RepID=A0A2C6LES4_9APIC|nr:50s ribosomal protein l21 [Cystoisospora suis]
MGSWRRAGLSYLLRFVGLPSHYLQTNSNVSGFTYVALYIVYSLVLFVQGTPGVFQPGRGIPGMYEGLQLHSRNLSSLRPCMKSGSVFSRISRKPDLVKEQILSQGKTHNTRNDRLYRRSAKRNSSNEDDGHSTERGFGVYCCWGKERDIVIQQLYRHYSPYQLTLNKDPRRTKLTCVPSFVSFSPYTRVREIDSRAFSPACYSYITSDQSSTLLSSSDRLTAAYPSIVYKTPHGDTPRSTIPPPESFPLYPPPPPLSRQEGDSGNEGPHGVSEHVREITAKSQGAQQKERNAFESWTGTQSRSASTTTGARDRLSDESRKKSRRQHPYGLGRHSPVVSPAQQKLLKLADNKDRSGSFFVAHLGGTQTIMERGRFYDLNRIHQREGGLIHLHRIICYAAPDGEFWLGRPYLENVRVTALVEKHFRGPKMYMAKARPKKWRKYFSHRQDMTRIRIQEVELLRNPGEVECASVPPNFTTDNPVYAALVSTKHHHKPSTFMPHMKTMFMRLAARDELRLLGDDPLTNYDPVVNQLLMDRLLAGHTELFPFLRPDKN